MAIYIADNGANGTDGTDNPSGTGGKGTDGAAGGSTVVTLDQAAFDTSGGNTLTLIGGNGGNGGAGGNGYVGGSGGNGGTGGDAQLGAAALQLIDPGFTVVGGTGGIEGEGRAGADWSLWYLYGWPGTAGNGGAANLSITGGSLSGTANFSALGGNASPLYSHTDIGKGGAAAILINGNTVTGNITATATGGRAGNPGSVTFANTYGGQGAVTFSNNTTAATSGDDVFMLDLTATGGFGWDFPGYRSGGHGYAFLSVSGNTFAGGAGTDTLSLKLSQFGNTVSNLDVSLNLETGILSVGGAINTVTGIENATLDINQNYSAAGNVSLTGNSLANILTAGAFNDSLNGGQGDDTLRGLAGNDKLYGGLGNDTMFGGAGNDTYYVDSTTDMASEETDAGGSDIVYASASYQLGAFIEKLTLTGAAVSGTGNDLANVLIGTAGANTLWGLGGSDRLNGGDGNDTIYGGDGNDRVIGDAGADVLFGGNGNDTYYLDNTGDSVSEDVTNTGHDDGGTDTVISTVSYQLGAFVENLTLTGAAATGTGNDLANVLTGADGDNTLWGLGGNDRLNGGTGNDTVYGGDGNDRVAGDGGADVLFGGNGNDTYYIDNPGDTVSEDVTATGHDDGGTDTVISTVSYQLGAFVENLILTGTALFADGNSLGNSLAGNNENNVLSGAGGNDALKGGLGDDILIGGTGSDRLTGGGGVDIFVFEGPAGIERDTITDFVSDTDHLVFFGADYGIDAGHVLTDAELYIGTGPVSAGALFVFNTNNHRLYFDSNGSAAGGLVSVAYFSNGVAPTASDFLFLDLN